jgi:hypothetical protein
VLLAIITAVLYLRAIAMGGFFGRNVLDAASAAPVMAMLLLLGAAGLILAWRWECAGGIVAILGAVALAVFLNLVLLSGRLLATLVYSSPFLIAGGMCLLDWWRQRQQDRAV